MAKIITLGEIMLRLSPEGQDRFVQSDHFRIIPGGGEANVAISCANYGHAMPAQASTLVVNTGSSSGGGDDGLTND